MVYIAKMAKFEKPLEICVQFFWFAIDRFFPLMCIFIVYSTSSTLFFATLLSTLYSTLATRFDTSRHIYISMPTMKPILSPILHVNTKSLLNDCFTNTYSCMCLSPLYTVYLCVIFLLTLYSTLLVIITHTTSSITHVSRRSLHTMRIHLLLLHTLRGQPKILKSTLLANRWQKKSRLPVFHGVVYLHLVYYNGCLVYVAVRV